MAVNRRKGIDDGTLSVIEGFSGREYVVGNNIGSKAFGYVGTLLWDLGLASGPHLRPQDRPLSIAERAMGPVGEAIKIDIEANRHRYDQRGPDAPGSLTAGGNFHVSEGTRTGMQIGASYPIIVASLASPGPEDLVMAGLARILARRGLRVVDDAGQWVLKSDAGDVVARGDEAVKGYIRREIKASTGNAGRLRDPKTGRFVSDPANPPSPYTFTDAQRRTAWKRLVQNPDSPLTPAQRAEIEARGWRGPQRVNEFGELETMELSHEPIPLREGGTNVVPRWPAEHAALDAHRQLKKRP